MTCSVGSVLLWVPRKTLEIGNATYQAADFTCSEKWRSISLLRAWSCNGKLPSRTSGGLSMGWVPEILLVLLGALLGVFFFWLFYRPRNPRRPPVDYTADERKVFEATQRVGPALVVAALVGFAALVAWAVNEGFSPPASAPASASWSWGLFAKSLGLYTLVAGAAAAVGGLAGFLFGIPRAREISEAIAQQGNDPAKTRRAVLSANTNLERVSDWLTTLLVGATLVQIDPIIKWIGALGPKVKADPASAVT